MQEKFGGLPAHDYIKKTATEDISKIVKFHLKSEPNPPAPGVKLPNDNSTFDENILYAMRKVDSKWNCGLCQTVEPRTGQDEIIKKASSASGLPSIYISGNFFYPY